MILKKIKTNLIRAKRVLPDRDRKPLIQIYRDLNWIKRKSPFKDKSVRHYFECLMYKKDAGQVDNYLPWQTIISFKRNSRHYKYHGFHPILGNKKKFKELLVDNNISTAKYLGIIKEGVLTTVSKLHHPLKENEVKRL